MTNSKITRAAGVAGLCAVVGAVAGIAGSAAAPSHHRATPRSGPTGPDGPGRPGFLHRGGPPVHSELIVPNQAGTGFDTITDDAGAFKSLSGDQLTITEGTKTATYKTVTLTIPSTATVYRNDAKAQLSALAAGDRVRVSQSPQGTFVSAEDAAHQASDGPGRGGPDRGGPDGFRHGGPRWGPPGGPPGGGPPGGGPPGPPPPGAP